MARLLIVEDSRELAEILSAYAERRGHAARLASTGGAALDLLSREGFDAAIVDLLLPDVRGTEVLDRLLTASIPAIAISGVYRGERYAQEASARYQVKAFFEKPFDLAALFAAVEREVGAGAVSMPTASSLDALERAQPVRDEGAEEADWERSWHAKEAAPTVRAAPEPPPAGTLKPESVPRLLTAAYQARHRGELVLRQGAVIKVLLLDRGAPIYAASNVASERFGRFCLRRGVLNEGDLTAVAELAKAEKLRTGEAMVRLGVLTAPQRRKLLEEQVMDILWSMLGWSEGTYSLSDRVPVRSDLEPLSLFPGQLIIDGTARTETLVSLRAKLPRQARLFPTADPPYDLADFRFFDLQARLLAYADGSKTVEDLLALTDLPERETLAFLLGLMRCGLLEERAYDPKSKKVSFGL